MTTTGRDINSINYRSINLVFVDSDKNILFCDTLSNNDYAIRNVEELEVYINDYLGGNLFLKTINLDDAYLYKFLRSKLDQQRWIDIENELRQYSLSFSEIGEMNIKLSNQNEQMYNSLRNEHKTLCKNLCEYLKIQVDKKDWLETSRKNNSIRQLLKKVNGVPLYVINFNYTQTIFKIESFPIKSMKQIHGSLDNGENIVFGVEDSSNLTTV